MCSGLLLPFPVGNEVRAIARGWMENGYETTAGLQTAHETSGVTCKSGWLWVKLYLGWGLSFWHEAPQVSRSLHYVWGQTVGRWALAPAWGSLSSLPTLRGSLAFPGVLTG